MKRSKNHNFHSDNKQNLVKTLRIRVEDEEKIESLPYYNQLFKTMPSSPQSPQFGNTIKTETGFF